MKFEIGETLTQAKIKKWFNESFYADCYKLVHFYKHNKHAYTVLMIDKKFGTAFVLYINTIDTYATTQMLSPEMVHDKHDVSELFF